MADGDEIAAMLGTVLDPIPEKKRTLMIEWAKREIQTRPMIIQASARVWVNAYSYKDDAGAEHRVEAGFSSLTWAVGQPSPQNPNATIFAMLLDDGPGAQGPQSKIAVYSFVSVKVEGSDDVGIQYFKEIVYRPDTTFGPISGEGLFLEFFDFFATDDEREEADGAVARAGGKANGASA